MLHIQSSVPAINLSAAGVEGPLYYLHNGALAFNVALPLALGLPAVLALRWLAGGGPGVPIPASPAKSAARVTAGGLFEMSVRAFMYDQ